MSDNKKKNPFEIIRKSFELIGETGISLAHIIIVVLVLYAWIYGVKTQWGEIHIDLFPKPYIYMK